MRSINSRPSSAAGAHTIRRSSTNTRSGATRASSGTAARASASVSGSTVNESSQANRARRKVRSGSRSNASAATARSRRRRRSSRPPNGSTYPGSCSGAAMALMVRSRRAQVLLDAGPVEGQEVQLPAAVVGDDPPGAEGLRQLEDEPAGRPAQRAGDLVHGAGDGHVEVGGGSSQRPGRAPPRPRASPAAPAWPAPAADRSWLVHPVAVIAARHAARDPAQDLMVDRPEPVGHVLHGLALVAERPIRIAAAPIATTAVGRRGPR